MQPAEATTTARERPGGSPVAAQLEDAVRELRAPLVRRITMIVGDPSEAEDIVQATFTKALESWSSFDGRDLRGWLYTIGIRRALDELRSRRRRSRLSSLIGRDDVVAPSSDVELWDALQHLAPAQRAALLLNVIDGYTQAEISELLASPPGTVASWIARAKSQLREALQEGDHDG